MGQYHQPVCIEAEEALNPYGMGLGAKEGEQGCSYPGTPNAMVALVCARGGNMPADCSQSTFIGKWAGKRVLVQGDYARDGDIPNWNGPLLSRLYHATEPLEERKPKRDWAKTPFYADISEEACGFLEAVCNVRYFKHRHVVRTMSGGEDVWWSTNWVGVEPVAKHFGNSGVAEYVIAKCYTADDLAYLKQQGMKPIDVQRAPRSGDWHGFRTEEIAEGQARVIVNLDTLEYINPVHFGQAPTLAGMVVKPPEGRALPLLKKADKNGHDFIGVATGLFAMLCHAERRGGGDLPATMEEMAVAFGGNVKDPRASKAALFRDCGDVKGRWRGGHILGTSEIRYEDWPTTEEVIERGTDISEKVLRYLVAVSHY